MKQMKEAFEKRRKEACALLLKEDLSNDLYGGLSVLRLIHNVDDQDAQEHLQFTADWFEHPHPHGRDHRGEVDFAAIAMIGALFRFYDKLSQECRASLDNFYLRRDFSSMHGSENHFLASRVSRLLAAEFYQNRKFEQYNITTEDARKADESYLDEFLMYRARHAWGEFDSLGYGAEDMLFLNTLYMYTSNERLKKKAAMSMDFLLMDMIVDSKNGVYGGAHGRIYPETALDSCFSTMVTHGKARKYHNSMYGYYCYYFGVEAEYPDKKMTHVGTLLSDYYPSDIVCKVAKNRNLPYENRERKHLHLMSAWGNKIDHKMLSEVEELSIDKYIYICEDYMLGGVNHQDAYPDHLMCKWYAHHQQHEWELTLPGNGRAKIFSHHPGDPQGFKIHNQWTGDSFCNCGTHFCTRDTAISLYNITRKEEYPFINANIPLEFFDEKILEPNYIFLRHNKIYIMVWFSNDYFFVEDGPTAGFEVLSNGRRHAFICHVEYVDNYNSIEEFAAAMKNQIISFDTDTMNLEFMGIRVNYDERWINGEKEIFSYQKLFNSPYLVSDYGSGILHVTDGTESAVLDFNF